MKYRYASIFRTTSGKWNGCVSQSKVNRKYISRTFSLYLATEKESSAGFVCKKSCGMLSKYWFNSVNICEIMRLRTNLISLVLKIISFFLSSIHFVLVSMRISAAVSFCCNHMHNNTENSLSKSFILIFVHFPLFVPSICAFQFTSPRAGYELNEPENWTNNKIFDTDTMPCEHYMDVLLQIPVCIGKQTFGRLLQLSTNALF